MIQYVGEEAIKAVCYTLIFITGRRHRSIRVSFWR